MLLYNIIIILWSSTLLILFLYKILAYLLFVHNVLYLIIVIVFLRKINRLQVRTFACIAIFRMSGRLKHTFKAQKAQELHVEKGTVVKLLEKLQDGKWYRVENNGNTGLVQGNYMEILEEIANISEKKTDEFQDQTVEEASLEVKAAENTAVSQETLQPNLEGKSKAVMKYKLVAKKEGELSVDKNVQVIILRKVNDGWNEVFVDGKSGSCRQIIWNFLPPEEIAKDVTQLENLTKKQPKIVVKSSNPGSTTVKATMKFKFEAQKEGELTVEKMKR